MSIHRYLNYIQTTIFVAISPTFYLFSPVYQCQSTTGHFEMNPLSICLGIFLLLRSRRQTIRTLVWKFTVLSSRYSHGIILFYLLWEDSASPEFHILCGSYLWWSRRYLIAFAYFSCSIYPLKLFSKRFFLIMWPRFLSYPVLILRISVHFHAIFF